MSRNNCKQIRQLLDQLNICYGIIRSIVHIVNIYLDDITIASKDEYLLMIQQLITLYDARLLLEELNKNIAFLMDGGAQLAKSAEQLTTTETTEQNDKEQKLYDIIQQFYSLSMGIQNSVSHIILKNPRNPYVKELHKEECASAKLNPAIKCCLTSEIIFKNLMYEYRKLNFHVEQLKTCLTQEVNMTEIENELKNYSIKCKDVLTLIQDTSGGNVELYPPIFEIFDESPKQIIDDSKLYIKDVKPVLKPQPKPQPKTQPKPEPKPELKPEPNPEAKEQAKEQPKEETKCDSKIYVQAVPSTNPFHKQEVVSMHTIHRKKKEKIAVHESCSNVDVSVNTEPIKFRNIAIVNKSNDVSELASEPKASTSTMPLKSKQLDINDIENCNKMKATIVNNIQTNTNGAKPKKKGNIICDDDKCIYIKINKENKTFQDVSNPENPGNERPIQDIKDAVPEIKDTIPEIKDTMPEVIDAIPEIKDGEYTRSVSLLHHTGARHTVAPNISIVNQDALSPAVWALTRVKISADGAKVFEVLDVSPFPPGRYLYNAPNNLHLLGIQPNHD